MMFEMETKLNQFFVAGFQQVMADIPADRINERPPGNGHPPLWVLGHLAICTELGQKLLGGRLEHVRWLPVFGPGSSDDVENPDQYSRDELVRMIVEGYPALCETAAGADPELLKKPHGVELLAGTTIETVEDIVAHLLSTHFAFHLAQLSAWRRAAGHSALF